MASSVLGLWLACQDAAGCMEGVGAGYTRQSPVSNGGGRTVRDSEGVGGYHRRADGGTRI